MANPVRRAPVGIMARVVTVKRLISQAIPGQKVVLVVIRVVVNKSQRRVGRDPPGVKPDSGIQDRIRDVITALRGAFLDVIVPSRRSVDGAKRAGAAHQGHQK